MKPIRKEPISKNRLIKFNKKSIQNVVIRYGIFIADNIKYTRSTTEDSVALIMS